jgi:phage tail sheath protein FI
VRTVKSSVIGIVGTAPDADTAAFPLDTPVLVAASRTEAAKLDTTGAKAGTLPRALDAILTQVGAAIVVIRVAPGENSEKTATSIIGGIDEKTGDASGMEALVSAESLLGLRPRILLAPGFSDQKTVADALLSIAARLRAIVLIDGPDTTDAAVMATEDGYRFQFDNSRGYLVDPAVKVRGDDGEDVTIPASPFVAGLIAKIDNERGFWWSPSNNAILGITGTGRPVDFLLGDENSRANLLNSHDVNTIIRESGFRLWGNRTLASIDRKYTFLPVRRTADMINDSIQKASLAFIDRPINRQLCESIVDTVNEYLRSLIGQGAILGGECWFERENNPNGDLMQGIIRFRYKFQPPTPAEHIIYESAVVEEYFDVLFSSSN